MICYRCGASVPETAERCPMCEQDLSAGATLAATPGAGVRARERASGSHERPTAGRTGERRAGGAKEKSEITHQLSVDDIFEESAGDEEDFLAGETPPAKDEDTTNTYSLPNELPPDSAEDSSPVLAVRGAAAAIAAEPLTPPEPDPVASERSERGGKPQSGSLPAPRPASSAPRPTATAAPARPEPTPRPSAAAAPTRPEPTPRPEAAPAPSRANGSRPRAPSPSDVDPVTGRVVELDKPKPLPELAPALEPEPAARPAREPFGGRAAPAVRTAVTAPAPRGVSVVALAVIAVALGLAVTTVAAVVLVVRRDDREADARRERAVRRVQERLKEAERLKSTPVPVTPTGSYGPEGCPLTMRFVAAATPYCIEMYEYPGGRTLPRANVTLKEARSACQDRGARLCSAAEWEGACRGPGGTDYPYGASADAHKCNVAHGPQKTREIKESGAFPGCKSAASVYDMVGNVAEWTDDGAYHGGSVESQVHGARCSYRVTPAADWSNPYVGFRCCAAPRVGAAPGGPGTSPAPATAPTP